MTMAEHLSGSLPPFGYACDVGANDGIFQSNTLELAVDYDCCFRIA